MKVWKVDHVERREAVLDLTSSGQERRVVTQLWADGECLCNGLALVEWRSDAFQIVVCGGCGIPECLPGGWVAARRAGAGLILLPAFEFMLEAAAPSAQQPVEYVPPDYFTTRGVPLLSPAAADGMRSAVAGLPPLHDVTALSAMEVLRLMQWCAPRNLLGCFPEPIALRVDALVASSLDSLDDALSVLAPAIANAHAESFVLRPLKPSDEVLTFYVNDARATEWKPMVRRGDQWLLSPIPGMVAEIDNE